MKVLVTGGAGYIGSITVKQLLEAGNDVTVFDNLSQGHKETVSCPLVIGDLLKKEDLLKLNGYSFDAVIHFAAYTLAGESMQNPEKYFRNNILGGLNLLEYMKEHKIPFIIFSSTCAIYGTPEKIPVTEEESKKPESVYGESKLMFETVLRWYDRLFGIKYINLRYFNACGGSIDGSLGEEHSPETHIIPVAMQALRANRPFSLFGTDYPTKDGTCIRDYIHVEDLATAHIQALEKLQTTKESDSINLGTGIGYSNREILDMVQKVSGKMLSIIEVSRRLGDPPIVYADNNKAKSVLGFSPRYSDLESIVRTAWDWQMKHKQ
ncbi:MAG TPA: UDP-glucose 4-epimerase GalE [Patescibacteria group bacterium]|nr:UDP-glucose 4-epimerase GalE [Patescibacteria group bacterium]